MPYSQLLEQRIRHYFDAKSVEHEARPMMGGLSFMVNGKMCVGVVEERLMARIDPAIEADAHKKPGCKPMDFTGRPMKGFVFVEAVCIHTASKLAAWLNLALDFNPKAKASKKRKS